MPIPPAADPAGASQEASPASFPVLTVNNRLARWLLFQHNEKQKYAGGTVWPTPEIVPWTTWMKNAWIESWPEKHILNDLQTARLWEKIVSEDPRTRELNVLHLRGAAKKAAEAFVLIEEQGLPKNKEAFTGTEETRSFFSWMQAYERSLTAWNALDPAQVTGAVHAAMQQGAIPLPRGVTLAGFEEITPRLASWLDFLRERSVPVHFDPELPPAEPPSLQTAAAGRQVEIRPCDDRRDEAVQCARWIRTHYRPGKRFGIVVPNLNDYRSLLERELKAELAPESVYPWVNMELPFNLSLGTPLHHQPPVQIALAILSPSTASVSLDVFLRVLQSPCFLPGRKNPERVQALGLKLFRENIVTLHLEELDRPGPAADFLKVNPELQSWISRWVRFIGRPGKKPPSAWAEVFSETLHTMGWPGKNLTSREFQIHEAWKECLDRFASLDTILGTQTRLQAAATLSGLCEDQLFQEKTPEQPIQVVGWLESAGMTFDALWVPGCHADALPASPEPNPFLPTAWRKRFALPRATVERELNFARHSLARWTASAPQVVFSHPEREGDTELRLSPLLIPLHKAEAGSPPPPSHRIRDQLAGAVSLELFEEPAILPPTPEEIRHFQDPGLRGGQSVIQNQSQCPFRAFARHRLHADPQEFPELDFDHRERGNCSHQVLEVFWREHKNMQNLRRLMQENKLEEAVRRAIEEAFQNQAVRLQYQERFRQLEIDRLTDLTLGWLELESERADFEVTGQEQRQELTISGLKLKLRIDRIDRIENAFTLLIDYKTGSPSPADWFEDRPQEPQLPLYSLQMPTEGIAFGVLKKGALKMPCVLDPRVEDVVFNHYSRKNYPSPADWQEQIELWKQTLTGLAGRFVAGQTEVAPHKVPQTCRNCGMQTLCRIGEAAQASGQEEDA